MNHEEIIKSIKDYDFEEVRTDFEKLKALTLDKIKFGSCIGNKVSDKFTFEERLNTRVITSIKPEEDKGYPLLDKTKFGNHRVLLTFFDFLENEKLLGKVKQSFLDDWKSRDISLTYKLYHHFQLYYQSVNQFKPIIAKWLYMKYKATSILDFSSGWGGRLVGAMSIPNVKYIGFDVNLNLELPYNQMIDFIECRNRATMNFVDSSTADFSKYDYDFVFTSPPYYNLEVYSNFPEYKDENDWYDKFLLKVVRNSYKHLKEGGHYALNIPIKMYERVKSVLGECFEKHPLSLSNSNRPGSTKETEYKEFIYIWKKQISKTEDNILPNIIFPPDFDLPVIAPQVYTTTSEKEVNVYIIGDVKVNVRQFKNDDELKKFLLTK
jgi:tRNA1(Val) A37 N6-methylase TrmN6